MPNLRFEYDNGTSIDEVNIKTNPPWGDYSRTTSMLQVKKYTNAGDLYVYDKGVIKRRRTITLSTLTSNEYAALINFIDNIAVGSKYAFLFTDWNGIVYDARFLNDEFVYSPGPIDRESVEIELHLAGIFPAATATFTRGGTACYDFYFNLFSGNDPRYWAGGKFGQGLVMERTITNKLSANQASVETDTTGFTAVGSPTLSSSSTYAAIGTCSLKAICGASEGFYTNSVTVSVSLPYVASVRLRTASGSVSATLTLQERTSADALVDAADKSINITAAWQRFDVYNLFGATGAKARMQVVVDAASTIYADALQIEMAYMVTNWMPGGSTRSSEVLSLPTAGTFNVWESTIDAWVYFSQKHYDMPGQGTVFHVLGTGSGAVILYYYSYNFYLYVTQDGTNYTRAAIPKESISTDTWHLITATISKRLGIIAIYLDKVLVEQLSTTYFPAALRNAMYIGSTPTGAGQYGLFDSIRLTNRFRSNTEITAYSLTAELPCDAGTTLLMKFENNLTITRYTLEV